MGLSVLQFNFWRHTVCLNFDITGFKQFTIASDFAIVVGWLKSIFNCTHSVHTKALGKVLIRRRLHLLQEVAHQEGLDVTVRWVTSAENVSNALIRVPKGWKSPTKTAAMLVQAVDDQKVRGMHTLEQVHEEHQKHNFGVEWTLELAREKFGKGVSKRMARTVMTRCVECAQFESMENWSSRCDETWSRLVVDITHMGGIAWLTMVDCGSGYTIWRHLTNAKEVRSHLEDLFASMGPSKQLMSNNGTVFRSRLVLKLVLLELWNVEQLLVGAYRPQGNGMVECVHRTIKWMVARSRNSVPNCAFWYNVTKGGNKCSPYKLVSLEQGLGCQECEQIGLTYSDQSGETFKIWTCKMQLRSATLSQWVNKCCFDHLVANVMYSGLNLITSPIFIPLSWWWWRWSGQACFSHSLCTRSEQLGTHCIVYWWQWQQQLWQWQQRWRWS